MAVSSLGQLFRSIAPEKKEGERTISYSQFAMWSVCPHRWKLNYIDRCRFGGPSIHMTFGTSFHETLQWYLHVMYTKSVKEADNINLAELLQEQMVNNYMLAVAENKDVHFSTASQLQEFLEDGNLILDYLKKHRSLYFSTKGTELVAIEMPLYVQASDANKFIMMNGFLDIVLRDTVRDRIRIVDIKTSTRGWGVKEKNDKNKVSQLVLYKSYLAKQYGYSEDKIDIEYFIVKRKLIDGYMYPQKRIQSFVPASGTPTRRKLIKEIDSFVAAGFNADGTHKTDGNFPARAEKGLKNCRWCEFADKPLLCPKENRIQ